MSVGEKICDPCQACCVALKIRSTELRKKSGTPCAHLARTGCGIYDRRPKTAVYLSAMTPRIQLNELVLYRAQLARMRAIMAKKPR